MAIDATKPSDTEDLVSSFAGYLREVRSKVNEIEQNETDDLLPSLSTAANADTSPTVSGVFGLKTANAGATTITFFDDGYSGQLIVLVAGDGNTTVQHDAGLIQLTSKSNVKLAAGETMVFILSSDIWREVGGFRRYSANEVITTYQMSINNSLVKANALGGAFTITTPDINTIPIGIPFVVKKVDSSENIVTVGTYGAELIDGAASLTIATPNESLMFVSDGINLIKIN